MRPARRRARGSRRWRTREVVVVHEESAVVAEQAHGWHHVAQAGGQAGGVHVVHRAGAGRPQAADRGRGQRQRPEPGSPVQHACKPRAQPVVLIANGATVRESLHFPAHVPVLFCFISCSHSSRNAAPLGLSWRGLFQKRLPSDLEPQHKRTSLQSTAPRAVVLPLRAHGIHSVYIAAILLVRECRRA